MSATCNTAIKPHLCKRCANCRNSYDILILKNTILGVKLSKSCHIQLESGEIMADPLLFPKTLHNIISNFIFS